MRGEADSGVCVCACVCVRGVGLGRPGEGHTQVRIRLLPCVPQMSKATGSCDPAEEVQDPLFPRAGTFLFVS